MSVRKTKKNKYSTVNEAVRNHDLAAVKWLIKSGEPVDVSDNRGWKPTHEAASLNFCEALEILLAQDGVDPNWKSHEGNTALMVASTSKSGDCEAVKLLLKHRADANITNDWNMSPLLEAVANKKQKVVEVLLKGGADVDIPTYSGVTALHQAVSEDLPDVVALLLTYHAKLDAREGNGITPIFNAAHLGHIECLKVLLQHAERNGLKKVLNICAEDGASPLYLAAQGGNVECMKLLLSHGADTSLCTTSPIAMALHAAVQMDQRECIKLLYPVTDQSMLAKCTFSLYYLTFDHATSNCLQYLLDLGFNPSFPHDVTPEMREYFVQMDSWTPHTHYLYNKNMTPMALFALEKQYPIEHANVLLKAGSVVNARGTYDLPPLVAALDNGNVDLAKLLIQYGACVHVCHPHFAAPVTVVRSLHHVECLKLILKGGACPDFLFKESSQVMSTGQLTQKHDYPCHHTRPEYAELYYVCRKTWEENKNSPLEDPPERSFEECHSFSALLRLAKDRMPENKKTVSEVLDILLQFTGTLLDLAADIQPLINSAEDWEFLMSITGSARSLIHLCRRAIRRHLSTTQLLEGHFIRKALPLPNHLMDYLLYTDL